MPFRLARMYYPRINVRIILPFLLVLSLVAIVAVFVVTRLVAGSIQERLNNQLINSAQSAQDTIVEYEDNTLAILRLMAFTEGVSTSITNADSERLDTLLRGIFVNENLYDLLVFGNNGETMFRLSRASNDVIQGNSLPTQTWASVQAVLEGNLDDQGDKFVDLIANENTDTLYIVAPVREADETIVGGLAIGIPMQEFTQLLGTQALSNISIFSLDDRVLASTFNLLTEIDHDQLRLEAITAKTALQTEETFSPIEEFTISQLDYQLLFVAFDVRSKNFGTLSVALGVDFVADQISVSRNSFILLFSGVIIAITLVGLWVARSIIQPIFQMVDTTRAIRSGDLSQRVRLESRDELGELGRSFDHMTDTLVERNAEISTLYQQQLKETAQRDAVLTSINDVVIVMDRERKIILHNHAADVLMDKILNDEPSLKVFADIATYPKQFFSPQTLPILERYYTILATPVRLDSGHYVGNVFVFHDITDIIAAEKLKDEMILQLSHELRTPLTAARGYAEISKMIAPMNMESAGDYITKSVRQMGILGSMIDQVIEVSLILANKLTLDVEEVNIVHVLYRIYKDHEEGLATADVTVNLPDPDDSFVVIGDATRLQQAIENVFRNAYYYNLAGGRVDVTIQQSPDCLVLLIADTGVGIEPFEQKKVFERMYRGKSADAGPTDHRGLGVGLYIAKEIIERHQGSIELRSQVDVGTEVTITLPTNFEEI